MPQGLQHTNTLETFWFSEKLGVSTAFHLDFHGERTGAHVSSPVTKAFTNWFPTSLNDRDVNEQYQNGDF